MAKIGWQLRVPYDLRNTRMINRLSPNSKIDADPALRNGEEINGAAWYWKPTSDAQSQLWFHISGRPWGFKFDDNPSEFILATVWSPLVWPGYFRGFLTEPEWTRGVYILTYMHLSLYKSVCAWSSTSSSSYSSWIWGHTRGLVLRRTTPGSHNFWIMMMCVSLMPCGSTADQGSRIKFGSAISWFSPLDPLPVLGLEFKLQQTHGQVIRSKFRTHT